MNYITIDGKKIELSKETTKKLKEELFQKNEVTEFLNCMNEYRDEQEMSMTTKVNNGYLVIETPNANGAWINDIFQAVIRFTQIGSRWATINQNNYIHIKLNNKG